MEYDIIIVMGEIFFDHPLCGFAILKRLLEKNGYTVGIIEMPKKEDDIKKLGKPKLFFGVSSGSIDSMVRNYTPLKKLRKDDKNLDYNESVPDRAVIVYCNWIRRYFKDSIMVIGGIEASLRRFVHYDYWDNKLRRPILFDSRADILIYGNAEKQILEIADRLKKKSGLENIRGTCIISHEKPDKSDIISHEKPDKSDIISHEKPDKSNIISHEKPDKSDIISHEKPDKSDVISHEKTDNPYGFLELPSYEEVLRSKERFCDMQNMFSNNENLAQKIDNRYVLQYKSPKYTSADLDEYYELPFTRKIPTKDLEGFVFSIVTHRGCIGDCNFCSLKLTQGSRIISRSEESILREIKRITKMPHFTGNIDDMGGPSANMYGMDCNKCTNGSCIDCKKLDRGNKRLITLLKKARNIKGVKKVFIRSGVRYELASPEYIKEVAEHHIFNTLRIAPEHVSRKVLNLMNKDKGNLYKFIMDFRKTGRKLSFYFMTAHPGSSINEARELAEVIKNFRNVERVQIFIPTPMTVSTCMYYTNLNNKTKRRIYVPYTYSEKKMQKRVIFEKVRLKDKEF